MSTVSVAGETHEVLQNPDKIPNKFTCIRALRYLYVNGGDSGGYFLLTNPLSRIISAENQYGKQKKQMHTEVFDIFADKIDTDTKKKPVVLRDFYTDTFYNGVYDETKQQFDNDYPLTPTNKNSLNDFLKSHTLHGLYSRRRVVFDPSSDDGINLDTVPYSVNLFRKPLT